MAELSRAFTADGVSAHEARHSRGPQRLRIGIADRDSGFVHILVKRLLGLAMEPLLVSAATAETLVSMQLDALVLDVTLMGEDPWPYLAQLSERLPSLGLVVCTGPSSVGQRVRALRLGVDAWVTKPCHAEELACLVSAVLRRNQRHELLQVQEPLDAGELTIRPDRYQAYVGERSLDLTAREFQLLVLLVQNDRVLGRDEIYERVWGYAMAHGDRSVDVFIRKLRLKLHAASPAWSYLHTHFGVGYRFAPERTEQSSKPQEARGSKTAEQRPSGAGKELVATPS